MTSSPIAQSHGPAMIGTFVNIFLYGMVVLQVWTYYGTYRNDPLWIKIYVAVLMLADTLNTLFSAWWIFDLTIMNFDNIAAFQDANWVARCDPAMGGILAFYCQAFFAWRLRSLTKNNYLAAFVVFLGFCVMIGGVGIAIALGYQPALAQISDFAPLVYIWLLPAVISDLTITISMTYYLNKRRTGFSRTEEMLNRIIRLTVQNCFLTTLCSIGDLASYLATPLGYHIGFSFPIPKLYSNAVLSTLNSRKSIRAGANWDDDTPMLSMGSRSNPDADRSIPLSRHIKKLSKAGITSGADIVGLTNSSNQPPAVYIDVETHEMSDATKRSDWSGLDDEDSNIVDRDRK